ncbi:DUF3179 domain-containing (seleno)protein [Ruegeria arenilitoris]|uniref:DUF3179 domain-containing (seleno)protein n=1 Tax=Ruegeria arenilitoris TaxID=1173585 RepID=UPI00148126DB|nr:DUF3179 domain-containing (seleno)protein [Ruegeria arenilitoris]
MLAAIVFYLSLLISLGIGFLYFRDLGDVSQMVLKVKRENMVRFIRNEYRLIVVASGCLVLMTVTHFGFGSGPGWIYWIGLILGLFLIGFPYVWVHVGLRNQKSSAQYFDIDEAREFVSPSSPVLVNENEGVARAHPDAQLMRPHLAGNEEGLGGRNVVMTYCAMANLGIGYTPEVEGKALDLEVVAQHGNNLILRDNNTGEPIQQIYGFREADSSKTDSGAVCPLKPSLAMKPWPTFRMTFRGFQKAYPDGTVFLNKPSSNPLLFLFDSAMEMLFAASIGKHHREAAPVMDNMSHFDDRLDNKTYVWGVDIDGDAVCWTDDFVVEQGNLVNTQVGGRPIVIAWHPRYESLGFWYNTTGAPVTEIDFFGNTPNGKLERVEALKPGMFWHVWVEFYPHTDINRTSEQAKAA